MRPVNPHTKISDGKAVTAALTGIPLDDLAGFIIIGIGDDGVSSFIHNCDDPDVLLCVLLEWAHNLVHAGDEINPHGHGHDEQ